MAKQVGTAPTPLVQTSPQVAPPPPTDPPKAKGGQPLAKGVMVTLQCEVVDVLSGDWIEIKPEGGTPFQIRSQCVSV